MTSSVQWCKGLQPRRGPAGAGTPAQLSPAPRRNTLCSQGALKALTPLVPLAISCFSPFVHQGLQDGAGAPKHPLQLQAPVWVPKHPAESALRWGTPKSWGIPSPGDRQPGAGSSPTPRCVRRRGCLHGNGNVRSVVRVAVYTRAAVGLPQIKMVMKYLAGPGVHQGSPIPSQSPTSGTPTGGAQFRAPGLKGHCQ